MAERASVVILGARGTVPVEGAAVSRYGGSTVSVLVRMGGATIVLDGGTGIMELANRLSPQEREVHLFLSHPHLDHMLGLPSCPVLYQPERRVHIYSTQRSGRSPRGQIERLMSPPLWPVGPEAFTAQVSYHTIEGDVQIGNVRVHTAEGTHPGGCSAFRLEADGVSVVYASDQELDAQSASKLSAFASGCSLLLCDGQYLESEYALRHGFGHSTWNMAAQLATDCAAQQLRIVHHAPWRTDAELDAMIPALQTVFLNGAFARYGEELVL